MEGKWSCYRGGKSREEAWSSYGGGQFNIGRKVMLQRGSLLEGEWSCYRSGH